MSDMVAKVLLRAAELVDMGHCKNKLAEDETGGYANPTDTQAVAWCATGAVIRAGHELATQESRDAFTRFVNDRFGGDCYAMLAWNNAPERTADEVAAALRAAAGAR